MQKAGKELVARWHTDAGRRLQQRINDFFFQLQNPGHGQTLDTILSEIRKFPGSDEVKSGKDFRGIHLAGGVHELDFSDADFSYAILELNFVNCNLSSSIFNYTDARGDILLKDLRNASFISAKLNGCFFRNGDLTHCNFDQASLIQANFEGSVLSGSSFKNAQCQRAKLLKADLRNSDFTGAILKEAVLQEARIDKTTNFSGANLTGAYCNDFFDKSGNRIAKGVDLREATYNEATIF